MELRHLQYELVCMKDSPAGREGFVPDENCQTCSCEYKCQESIHISVVYVLFRKI
jgi:hypothetical protein